MDFIRNRKSEASVHAHKVIQMMNFMQKDNKEVYDSSLMLEVFGPLVFSDATFFIPLSLGSFDSNSTLRDGERLPVSFKERVTYHQEIIRMGGGGIV